ncbi:MAG TPA: FAD-dependent oxidoreductase [Thermoanaerobaculia bacterium]|jgi:glycine/D-amino acid oxidase-like deaminating enzyme|nr:FAD-dependent oxidoreductase [Thermoanaerobaculia bacterium]
MELSRRTFLEGVAAVPLLAFKAGSAPRVVVIGAGSFGAWTALHLQRLGAQVTLVDAWGPGNTRSSSGGESRVIRAIYGPDRIYVEMVKRSYELWEQLDPSLYVETGALWLHRGDDAYVRSSVPVLKDLGFPVEQIALAEAARRYPQISFGGITSVWLERRAGALSARRACGVVRDAFVKNGGMYQTAHVDPTKAIDADAAIFACGPWLGKLFPDVIGDAIAPTRQEVFYFGTPRGSDLFLPSRCPIWIDFGERIVYGIPDIHGRGFKLADDTRGEPFDPTTGDRKATEEGLARARRALAERFPELANAPLLASEVCQYENSPDGNLILDRHPTKKNVWLVGGGSGHGFKLSPAVGEMTAQAVLGRAEPPKMFALARLAEAKRSTQFERN